jgi:hypothetical protein
MIDEIIICPSFTNTSQDVKYVIRNFVRDGNGILFEILLHADDAKADVQSFSVHPNKSKL